MTGSPVVTSLTPGDDQVDSAVRLRSCLGRRLPSTGLGSCSRVARPAVLPWSPPSSRPMGGPRGGGLPSRELWTSWLSRHALGMSWMWGVCQL